MNWKDFKEKHLLRKEALIVVLFFAMGAGLFFRTEETPIQTGEDPIRSLETFIPAGHQLIPIDLANADKLSGVLGGTGVVDLYQAPDAGGRKGSLVGRRFRILRAPLNPQSFAVLIRHEQAAHVLSFPGPFIASLRGNEHVDSELPAASRPGPQIEYQTTENP